MTMAFVALAGSVLVFLGFLLVLYRSLRWLWIRLPFAGMGHADNASKLVGTLVALALFPQILVYAWSTIQSLLNLVPHLIGGMSDLKNDNCVLLDRTCAERIFEPVPTWIASRTGALLQALDLKSFPIETFVWFILTLVIAVQLVELLRSRISLESLRYYSTASGRALASGGHAVAAACRSFIAAIQAVPKFLWQRLVFTVLVVVSFYLGLTALLAIPLLQDKTRGAITAEQLTKAIDSAILSQENFDNIYVPELPVAPQVTQHDVEQETSDPNDPFLGALFVAEEQRQGAIITNLRDAWGRLRKTAFHKQREISDSAKDLITFNASIATRKQFERYYADLYDWHRESMRRIRNRLSACHNTALQYTISRTRALERSSEANKGEPELETILANFFRRRTIEVGAISDTDAVFACRELSDEDLPSAPKPPSIAAILGPIGLWTSWVIDPQLMPVVIIIGLVGFSLLGATVSRVVRVQNERQEAALTLDDLLIVVAGGTTAAVVVFLAAYGGLAVLGSPGGDPNPYLVFATCLIGAVFSEDVWTWARQKLSVSQTRPRRPRPKPESTQKPSKPHAAPDSP
jgi:hypothetical protein